MELSLKKIRADDESNIYMAIEVHYGFAGAMFADIVRLNFHTGKHDVFVSFRVMHAGIISVAERIDGVLREIMDDNGVFLNPRRIIEHLETELGMRVDWNAVDEVLHDQQQAPSSARE